MPAQNQILVKYGLPLSSPDIQALPGWLKGRSTTMQANATEYRVLGMHATMLVKSSL